MEPIRILQVVPNMQQGGIENFIMNIYRNIDRNKVQFDFLVHYNREYFFDKEIKSLGGEIYHFPIMENPNILKYFLHLNKFFKKHTEYKVIHAHMASLAFFYLGIAKHNSIKIRIIHSHEKSFLKNIKGYIKYFLFKLAKYNANYYFACSTEAGKYLFKNRTFEIIPNAIDFEKFKYDYSIRYRLRKEMNLENKFIIGHIGRFNSQKNHDFIIETFYECQKNINNAILMLIGCGELEDRIRKKVKDLNIENKVLFLGTRKDVNELYQTMDLFIMPSKFEGLPVSGIEAQVNGLQCIFSDNITREVDISKKSLFLPLDEILWKDKIIEQFNNQTRVMNYTSSLIDSSFDIKKLAKIIQERYVKLYNEK